LVAVDFERDSLAERLEEAGHDPAQPTVWVWEGVTMYLGSDAIDATLKTVSQRSASGSRLLVTYLSPSFARQAVGFLTRFVGEPMRSQFSPEQMAARLGRFGFEVSRDECGVDWNERWARRRVPLPRFVLEAERLATADKA
jgi:methyltransferase (TIGR00027 family)